MAFPTASSPTDRPAAPSVAHPTIEVPALEVTDARPPASQAAIEFVGLLVIVAAIGAVVFGARQTRQDRGRRPRRPAPSAFASSHHGGDTV